LRPIWRRSLVVALLVLHALAGHRYAAAWVSDATLWRWAGPATYRAMTNYQKAVTHP
jgi:hypothetical protein